MREPEPGHIILIIVVALAVAALTGLANNVWNDYRYNSCVRETNGADYCARLPNAPKREAEK